MTTTIDFDAALAAVGGAKQVHRSLVDSERRARLLDAKIVELIKEHPNEWVAMPERDTLLFASTHDALLQQMRATGKPTNTAVIKFLDPEPKTMIL